MIVYQTDQEGRYVGAIQLNKSDICPISGKWLLPGGCVEAKPPEILEGKELFWREGSWLLKDIPKEPEPEPQSLGELKLATWNRIKSTRDALEQSGVPYMGKILDSDPVSVQRISIAVQAAQAAIGAEMEFAITWTMQDNSILPMTATEVCGMPVALAMYSNHLHEIARGLRDLIEIAQSVEELDSIVWPEV